MNDGISSPRPQTATSSVIQKKNNEQSRRWSKQRDSVTQRKELNLVKGIGFLWREEEVKLPKNLWEFNFLERRLQKNVEPLMMRYSETTDNDVNAGYVPKVDQT